MSLDELVELTSSGIVRMPWYETLLLGCGGGVLPDIMGIVKARHGKPPTYLKNPFFWISLFILAIVGGGVSYLAEPTRVIEALSFGYSAPTLISKVFGSEHPPETLGSVPIGGGVSLGGGVGLPIPNFLAPLQRWWSSN